MFSRIFNGIRTATTATTNTVRPQRLSIEDHSSEEILSRAATSSPINIISTTTSITAIFGLSNNKTDDFIQKDLISSSWS